MKNPAVFLDRDGTIIEDSGYPSDESEVRLLSGVAEGIRRISQMGYLVVVVSNQSGVARGLFSEADLSRVHARLEELLQAEGASLDGTYYCPYLDGPEAKVDAYRRESTLRKPAPGMILQAAREMDIDLPQSWMIGNSTCDVEAGARAGCRTILLRPEAAPDETDGRGRGAPAPPSDKRRGEEHGLPTTPTYFARGILEAAEILESEMNASEKTPPRDVPPDNERTTELLEQIHQQLVRANRQQRQHDFSILRLFGALLQMLAVVTALWGAVALFGDDTAHATPRLALACFLQLASISAFAIDRFR